MSLPAQKPNPLIPPMDPQQLAKLGFSNPFASLQPPTPTGPNTPGGFQAFASDVLNQNKVASAMTPPGSPLHPNAPQGSPVAPQAKPLPDPGIGKAPLPTANAPQFAALQPPSTGGLSSINPPMPKPMASLNPPVSQEQIASDQAELQRLQQSGAAVNHIQNPFLRTLGKIGDIAAPFILGGGAAAIPGTTLHNRYLQNQAQGRVNNDLASNQTAAQTAQTQMQTAMAPVNAQYKQQKNLASLAEHGLKVQENEDGTTSVVPDEQSPVYQQQQQKNELMDAQAQAARANVELRQATAAYNKAKTDPNSPLFKQTAQRLAIAQENAKAAGTRASAFMGRYLQSAYGIGLGGDVLPGSSIIQDDSGNQSVVGTANAPQATKAQSNVAMFNEVDSATKSMRQAASDLAKNGGKLNSPAVVAAIADPNTTSGQWLQGEVANSNLTPAERNYVIKVKAYKERLQPLRKSAGGGVSDSQVDRLLQLAPGASTPDLDYFNRQLNEIDQLRGNLAQGVTTATGGLKVSSPLIPPKGGAPKAGPKAAAAPSGPPAGATMRVPGSDGKLHWSDGKRDLGVVQ